MNPSKPFNLLRTCNPICWVRSASPNLQDYRKFIAGDEDKVDLDVIRKQTRLGKSFGDRGFLEMLSKKLGYKLNFRSKGRPKTGCVSNSPHSAALPGNVIQ